MLIALGLFFCYLPSAVDCAEVDQGFDSVKLSFDERVDYVGMNILELCIIVGTWDDDYTLDDEVFADGMGGFVLQVQGRGKVMFEFDVDERFEVDT